MEKKEVSALETLVGKIQQQIRDAEIVKFVQDQATPKPVVATEKPEDFKLNATLDSVGLPLEHVRYASKKCTTCYGRGIMRLVVVDGTQGSVFDAPETRVTREVLGAPVVEIQKPVVKNPNRQLKACACVRKGHAKLYSRYQDVLIAAREVRDDGFKFACEALGITKEEAEKRGAPKFETEEELAASTKRLVVQEFFSADEWISVLDKQVAA